MQRGLINLARPWWVRAQTRRQLRGFNASKAAFEGVLQVSDRGRQGMDGAETLHPVAIRATGLHDTLTQHDFAEMSGGIRGLLRGMGLSVEGVVGSPP